MEFDFDAWVRLARENPEEFERRRSEILQASIDSAPVEHRKRLEGLQFQINMERQRAGTALGACVKLNSMMWAGFFRLRRELSGLTDGKPTDAAEPSARNRAEVISMEKFARARRAASGDES